MGIFTDAAIGGLICGVISYFAKSAKSNQAYNTFLKIFAYLWAAPIFYVYVIYILLRNGTDLSVNSFVVHALVGAILSVLLLFGTKFIINSQLSRRINIIFNLTFCGICVFVYFVFRLYLL